jgi:insertion element IS1 protein InsB
LQHYPPRQVVAYVVGDRSRATCHKLWAAIPRVYLEQSALRCGVKRRVTNSGRRSLGCITAPTASATSGRRTNSSSPPEQQTAAGKESGLTAHFERWNNTLRQRLGRFVRKSLSFSKSDTMHEVCLRLFLHDYNKSLALSCD